MIKELKERIKATEAQYFCAGKEYYDKEHRKNQAAIMAALVELLEVKNLAQPDVRRSLPLTNQKLWDMAKVITVKQKTAKEHPTEKVDWNMLEEMWFDWLEEELFGNDD